MIVNGIELTEIEVCLLLAAKELDDVSPGIGFTRDQLIAKAQEIKNREIEAARLGE